MTEATESYRRGPADTVFEGLFWGAVILVVAFIGAVIWKATA